MQDLEVKLERADRLAVKVVAVEATSDEQGIELELLKQENERLATERRKLQFTVDSLQDNYTQVHRIVPTTTLQ